MFYFSDQKKIYIGDDNPLTLIVTAENQGEGAYEAELFVIVPPQADFIGVVRNNEVKLQILFFFESLLLLEPAGESPSVILFKIKS